MFNSTSIKLALFLVYGLSIFSTFSLHAGKPIQRKYIDECFFTLDHDNKYAEAIVDIRQNFPYDIASMPTEQLRAKLQNPHETQVIIDNLLAGPFVNALDLIGLQEELSEVATIKIKNMYTMPKQYFWLSCKDVLANFSLFLNNKQVLEALAQHCIQSFIYNTADAGLVLEISAIKTFEHASSFKEMVVNGIIENFPMIQKNSSLDTTHAIWGIVIDLSQYENEELLNRLMAVIKEHQDKSLCT